MMPRVLNASIFSRRARVESSSHIICLLFLFFSAFINNSLIFFCKEDSSSRLFLALVSFDSKSSNFHFDHCFFPARTSPSDHLLDATEMGKWSMEDFICTRINTNEVNFWDTLPKFKINTFSSAAKKMEVKATNNKIITLTKDRELFGQLLVVAKQRDIVLQEVLRYQFSAVPVAIAHGDGGLRKTTKSSLMSVLETTVAVLPSPPPSLIPTAFFNEVSKFCINWTKGRTVLHAHHSHVKSEQLLTG